MTKRFFASSALCVLVATGCGSGVGLSDEIVAGKGERPAESAGKDAPGEGSNPPPGQTGGGAPSPGEPTPPSPIPTPMPSPPTSEPLTALSPYHPSGSLTFQRPVDWTISALDPSTVIRYTLDGSTPTPSSPSATGKVTLYDLEDGTKIRWIAGSSTIVHALDVGVDGDLKNDTHWLIERVRFDASGGPVVKVAKGAHITGRATAAVWNGYENCPNCIDQVTVGIATAAACIISTNPQTYPGQNAGDVSFDLVAPQTAGIYKLKAGFAQEYNCKPDALGTKLDPTEVGTIVVE